MDTSKQTRNLRLGIIEGLLATPWTLLLLPAGFILSALLTLYFEIPPDIYGLIVSMPAWANASQIVLAPVVAKFLDARDLNLSQSWINLGLWIMMAGAIGYLPIDDPASTGRFFILFFALSAMTQALGGIGWTQWVRQWTPAEIRGDYFGRRNALTNAVTIAYLLIAMATLDWFGDSLWAYQVLIIIALLCRFFSVLLQHQISVPPDSDGTLAREAWLRELASLRHYRPFLAVIAFGAWCGFWMNLTGPFIPRFVYEHLEIAPWVFALLHILATLTGALSVPLWGKLMDRHGCVPVIVIALSLWQLQNYFWVIVTPATDWMLYPMWLWGGATASAYFLGLFNLTLKMIPDQARAAGISANMALTSGAAAVSPVLAGQLIEWANVQGWDVLLVYRIGFFVGPTMLLAGAFALRALREPAAAGPGTVMDTMRTARQILQVQGANFLANATYENPLAQRLRRTMTAKRPPRQDDHDAPGDA